eukprot:2691270-Rhodomonas_salina.1
MSNTCFAAYKRHDRHAGNKRQVCEKQELGVKIGRRKLAQACGGEACGQRVGELLSKVRRRGSGEVGGVGELREGVAGAAQSEAAPPAPC